MDQTDSADECHACLHMTSGEAAEVRTLGAYHVTCYGADGQIKWEDDVKNIVTTVGKNSILDLAFITPSTPAWFVGLVTGPGAGNTYLAADTMASHAGWTEFTTYSNATRGTFSAAAPAGGVITSIATPAAFTINGGGGTVAGLFLTSVNTKGGATGILMSVGNFATGDRTVIATDVLSVYWQLTLT